MTFLKKLSLILARLQFDRPLGTIRIDLLRLQEWEQQQLRQLHGAMAHDPARGQHRVGRRDRLRRGRRLQQNR